MKRTTINALKKIIQEAKGSTEKYDDDSALRGKQSKLPDALQKGIIDKSVEDREEREEEEKLKEAIRKVIRETLAGRIFMANIEDPAMQAEDMGMSHREFVQPYEDIANRLGLTIVENIPENFVVKGPEASIIEFGFQMNQLEGGPSFNEDEFREYAMWEV